MGEHEYFLNLNRYPGSARLCKRHGSQPRRGKRSIEGEDYYFVGMAHAEHEPGPFLQHVGVELVGTHESYPAVDFGSFFRQDGGIGLGFLNLLIELKEGDEPALAVD